MYLVTQASPATDSASKGAGSWGVPLGCGIAGALMICGALYLRKRHWAKVRGGKGAGEFGAVWTDVLLQMVALLGGLLALTAVLLAFAVFRL